MGDRTTVILKMLVEDSKAALSLLGFEPQETNENQTGFVDYSFYEVNYGNLNGREHLQKQGISYDLSWGNGDSFTSGMEYCRFSKEGELLVFDVYDNEVGLELHLLKEAINDHAKLIEMINRKWDSVTPLPWDKQSEYSKIFRTLQLINPT